MPSQRIKMLLQAIRRLPRWQRVAVGAMVLLVVLTWLSACLVLASYLAP